MPDESTPGDHSTGDDSTRERSSAQVPPADLSPTNLSPTNLSPAGLSPAGLSPSDLRLQAFNDRALSRMFRTMLVVSVLTLPLAFWKYKVTGVTGFAAGAIVSCINFRALQRSVEGLADRIVNRQSHEKGGRIVLRFILRYALVGAAAYAIFNSSALAFRGFLWGLCLPVTAMMIEAGAEAVVAIRER
jgi:hypothetical protein